MNREFKDALEDSPVIAAIKDDNGLKECLKSDIQVVFILYGDICNIADIVDTVKQAGKMAKSKFAAKTRYVKWTR